MRKMRVAITVRIELLARTHIRKRESLRGGDEGRGFLQVSHTLLDKPQAVAVRVDASTFPEKRSTVYRMIKLAPRPGCRKEAPNPEGRIRTVSEPGGKKMD